ncbi:MAG: DNA methyltransferase [Polyangiaceae bacterium]|jgi:DNA modification methylase
MTTHLGNRPGSARANRRHDRDGEPPRAQKQRRSLTHVGGAVATWGDPDVAATLAQALDVRPSSGPAEDSDRAHVHGFHTYPARMHPTTASRLVRTLSSEGATVLDPFCGSGTVLIEAMLHSRRAIGTDLNPLAVRLARLKTTRYADSVLASMVSAARSIAIFAEARRIRRAGATRRYPREDAELFDPHVLLELDSLRAGIVEQCSSDPLVRDALELVLSAILIKVSRGASDTSTSVETRRIAAGFASRLFARKADELSLRLAELARRTPVHAALVVTALDNAARLQTIAASTVDVIVTSPPYAGTYDYLSHHAVRMRWLGLDAGKLASGEIGARRNYERLDARSAREAWAQELGRALRAMRRVCRRGARVVLLLADSAVGEQAIRADAVLGAIAPDAGFAVLARASQARPHFHGPSSAAFRDGHRAEHAILLEKR